MAGYEVLSNVSPALIRECSLRECAHSVVYVHELTSTQFHLGCHGNAHCLEIQDIGELQLVNSGIHTTIEIHLHLLIEWKNSTMATACDVHNVAQSSGSLHPQAMV
jgi:hypothetical protein